MSKSLEEYAVELERKAREKAHVIRRVVKEYNACLQGTTSGDAYQIPRKQREIERVVAQYIQLYKALKRLRKKMRAKRE
ncbi:MAG: hypothetical protein WBV94_28525 [Blastocatellia bacterium]